MKLRFVNIATFNILIAFGNQNLNNGKSQNNNQVLKNSLCPFTSRMD